jgi:predicted AlkP superfamily pyrophosphatase or phosphodiesterase
MMTDFPVPDYSNSILSVSSSILHHYDVKDCSHPGQPLVDAALKRNPRNVVLMLFDGMGLNLLQQHLPEDSFLRSHMQTTVSSVFPPTTVAATTSIQSGLSPAEHGWLGWTLYFKEVQDNVSTFSNKLVSTGKPASKVHLAEQYMPYVNVCDRIMNVHPEVKAENVSWMSHYHTFSVGSSCRRVKKILKQPGQHYIYCYWINPDHLIHTYGVTSQQVHDNILKINRQTEQLCSQLKDTTVIILADHGVIDTKWVYLEDHPELMDLLLREPSMETRAASLFIKAGKQEEFKEKFQSAFGDKFALLTREEVLKRQLFGPGETNARINEFVGDYIAIATGDTSLNTHHKDYELIGMHAGLTTEELTVPLIIVNC